MVDDLRSAFRQILSNPGFSLAVVLTLALGVGATAAVFTLADPMLFRPLPFPDSDRLVRVRVNSAEGKPFGTMPLADYLRIEAHHAAFSAVCTFNIQSAGRLEGFEGAVSVNGIPGAVAGYAFTEGCFDTFGIRPVIGRAFAPEEYPTPDQPATVAIVTDAFWRTALGGRSDVIGQTLRFAGPRPQAFVIVGVMPPEFIVPQTINPAPCQM
jgi:putative ABC transport system permease protein